MIIEKSKKHLCLALKTTLQFDHLLDTTMFILVIEYLLNSDKIHLITCLVI